MKSIDADQLNRDIEAIPEVCDKGKDAIKRLFANNFGVDFGLITPFLIDGVYKTEDNWIFVLLDIEIDDHHYYYLKGIIKGRSLCWSNNASSMNKKRVQSVLNNNKCQLLANNLQEYFTQKRGA